MKFKINGHEVYVATGNRDLDPEKATVLFIHGTADRVVPYHFGKKLFEKAKPPKKFLSLKNGAHTAGMDHYKREAIPAILKFFEEQN